MDKDLLRALGYSEDTISKIEKWDSEIKEYFKDDKDHDKRTESYYQADYKKGAIVFRDDCPRKIANDLNQIFKNIFSTPKS